MKTFSCSPIIPEMEDSDCFAICFPLLSPEPGDAQGKDEHAAYTWKLLVESSFCLTARLKLMQRGGKVFPSTDLAGTFSSSLFSPPQHHHAKHEHNYV
jgi:hypothetical protein